MLNAKIGRCARRAHGCASLWLALAIGLISKATQAAADALSGTPRRSRLVCGTLTSAVWTAMALAAGSAQAVTYTVTDLGSLTGANGTSYASGINDSGQVVGSSFLAELPVTQHAFLYSGEVMTDLGTLTHGGNAGFTSYAQDINNSGQVVGGSSFDGITYEAFLYSGGVMTDLGILGGRKRL